MNKILVNLGFGFGFVFYLFHYIQVDFHARLSNVVNDLDEDLDLPPGQNQEVLVPLDADLLLICRANVSSRNGTTARNTVHFQNVGDVCVVRPRQTVTYVLVQSLHNHAVQLHHHFGLRIE